MTMIIMVMAVMLAKCCKVSEPMEPKKSGNMLLSQWASFIRKMSRVWQKTTSRN